MAFGFGARKDLVDSRRSERDDAASFKDLSLQEKLLMAGAVLQGDTATAAKIPLLAQARRKQADEKAWRSDFANSLEGVPMKRQALIGNSEGDDITAGFAPQMETVRGPRPTLRDLVPKLAKAREMGIDIGDEIELLKATDPDIAYEQGMRYDKRDPASAPKEVFGLEKGQRRIFDADGRAIGVMNADGFVQSIADVERAKTRASEEEKAALDIVRLPTSDGSEVPMTRRDAAKGLDMTGVPMRGQPPQGPAAFRTQTPAEKALAEGRARNTVEQEGMTGKATTQAGIDLPKVDAQVNNTLDIINQIRRHPSIDDRTGNSTLLPAIRPRDVDFDTLVKQLSGGAFLEAIQLLKGTGQITEIEGKKATDAIARMGNQRQSKEGFLKAMADYEGVVNAGRSRARNTAANGAGAAPAGRITPEQARAELARRRAAKGQ